MYSTFDMLIETATLTVFACNALVYCEMLQDLKHLQNQTTTVCNT